MEAVNQRTPMSPHRSPKTNPGKLMMNWTAGARFLRRSRRALAAGATALAALVGFAGEADAQEIQLTGPLAGAPAVRKLRLHREGRFEISPSVSFTLLDEYRRTIMPGLRLQYHPTDWLGLGVWGGYGIQYNTGLSDQLQEKAIDARACTANASSRACRLTAVNLTRGDLAEDQLAGMQWTVAPQVTFVPFRGKLALFSALFVDTDVHFFAGPAFIGVKERGQCGPNSENPGLQCSAPESFVLESRVAIAPTFGLGLNFYPSDFFGFGAEWRALPYAWNTSGFDNLGGGPDEEFPDNSISDADSTFSFNSMLTINLTFALPPGIDLSE
jgi:hypothetical protein